MLKSLVTFLLFSLPYEQKFKEVYFISIKNQRSIFLKKMSGLLDKSKKTLRER